MSEQGNAGSESVYPISAEKHQFYKILADNLRAEIKRLRVEVREQTERAESAEDEAATLAGQIERLEGIVNMLPKTADGIPITPEMEVFFRCGACDGKVDSMVPINGVGTFLRSQFYSTREAAAAESEATNA